MNIGAFLRLERELGDYARRIKAQADADPEGHAAKALGARDAARAVGAKSRAGKAGFMARQGRILAMGRAKGEIR